MAAIKRDIVIYGCVKSAAAAAAGPILVFSIGCDHRCEFVLFRKCFKNCEIHYFNANIE